MLRQFAAHITYVLLLAFSTHAFAASKYNSAEEMVADQKTIRVLMDETPGFGNQSATINMMNRLRQMKFQGTFEFIYPVSETAKVISLFNLPKSLPDIYYYEDKQKNKITFIREDTYINQLINNKITPATLGITGAHDSDEESACEELPACNKYAQNFADFTNTTVFVELQPWFNYPERSSIDIQHAGKHLPIDPPGKFLVFPVANFADAKDYLANDPDGKELSQKNPALSTFIAGIEQQNFNVLPIYGYTFQKKYNDEEYDSYVFPYNIIQAITAARYAQLNEPTKAHKPIIIAVFYDYTQEIAELTKLIYLDNWGEYEKHGANYAREALNKLSLKNPNIFLTAAIADADASKKIQSLQPGQILLLSMGTLPKIVFDGIYSHDSSNIWPQIREGESSLSTLILKGRPQLRCGTFPPESSGYHTLWEPGFDLVKDAELKQRLTNFYGKDGFCTDDSWIENPTIYQAAGEFIIESMNTNSSFSHYFTDLKTEALKPQNDRIYRGLETALAIINNQTIKK